MKRLKFSLILLVIVGMTYSCNSATNASGSESSNGEPSSASNQESKENSSNSTETNGAKSKRLRIEEDLKGHKTLLILNSAVIAKKGMSDFYLKVGDLPHKDITVSSVTRQGLVSKNKEDFYFGVKPTEGSTEIDLNIIITEKSGERLNIGTLTLPIEK